MFQCEFVLKRGGIFELRWLLIFCCETFGDSELSTRIYSTNIDDTHFKFPSDAVVKEVHQPASEHHPL